MNEHGIEVRKNGNQIHRYIGKGGFRQYKIILKDGTWSKNGPFDYLYNARQDADGLY